MLEQLLDLLICPACLPEEYGLAPSLAEARNNDILEGVLLCPGCGTRYPIQGGLAELVPPGVFVPKAQARYDEWRVLASYLFSQYADLWDDPQATDAYGLWAQSLPDLKPGPGLDAGCAVGRFTFELAGLCGFAVGLDLSRSFVFAARKLARQGGLGFEAPREGRLRQSYKIELPQRLRENKVEFILADAQALPFRAGKFAAVASLNLVDKLPNPLKHLRQCQRVCAKSGSLLFSDPFSWSEDIAPFAAWLGGTPEKGPALEYIPRLLSALPGWSARAEYPVWWSIRDHANRFERIQSQVILAKKSS